MSKIIVTYKCFGKDPRVGNHVKVELLYRDVDAAVDAANEGKSTFLHVSTLKQAMAVIHYLQCVAGGNRDPGLFKLDVSGRGYFGRDGEAYDTV